MPDDKNEQKKRDIKKDAADPVDAKTKPWRPPKTSKEDEKEK